MEATLKLIYLREQEYVGQFDKLLLIQWGQQTILQVLVSLNAFST